jgi:serine protease Do
VAVLAAAAVLLLAAAGFGIARLIEGSSSTPTTSESAANQTGPIEWLGMQIEGIPPGSVVVATVAPGSPAEQDGLSPGDVLLAINGRPINSPSDIGRAISGMQSGDQVTIQVSRGSTRFSTRATLAAPPSSHP